MPYIGLVHSCLGKSSPSLDESFGPVRAVLNTGSATGRVEPTPMKNFLTVFSLIKALIGGRLAGRHQPHPFFAADGAPLCEARVLTLAEREKYSRVRS